MTFKDASSGSDSPSPTNQYGDCSHERLTFREFMVRPEISATGSKALKAVSYILSGMSAPTPLSSAWRYLQRC